MPENIIEGLQSEISRVKEIVVEYEHPSLRGTGYMAAFIMKSDIAKSEKSINDMDLVSMINCIQLLRGYYL